MSPRCRGDKEVLEQSAGHLVHVAYAERTWELYRLMCAEDGGKVTTSVAGLVEKFILFLKVDASSEGYMGLLQLGSRVPAQAIG